MVSLSERDAVFQGWLADAELRPVTALLFEQPVREEDYTAFPHADLLRALAEKDGSSFRTQFAGFARRPASEGSGWYENDCLVFLLLAGCYRFEVDPAGCAKLLEARERNTNPAAKRVNEVFRQLSRHDLTLETPFGFMKLPLLKLSGKLRLTNEGAARVYTELTRPGMLGQLSPFLQVLAYRAHDLVLTARLPQTYENFEEILRAVEKAKAALTVGQIGRLLWAVPYKSAIAAIVLLLSVGSFWFGFGRKTQAEVAGERERPAFLQVVGRQDAAAFPEEAVRQLAAAAMAARPQSRGIALVSSTWTKATPRFSAEATAAAELVGAQAWLVSPGDGGENFTVLPVQVYRQSARAFLAGAPANSRLVFVLIYREAPGVAAPAASIRLLE